MTFTQKELHHKTKVYLINKIKRLLREHNLRHMGELKLLVESNYNTISKRPLYAILDYYEDITNFSHKYLDKVGYFDKGFNELRPKFKDYSNGLKYTVEFKGTHFRFDSVTRWELQHAEHQREKRSKVFIYDIYGNRVTLQSKESNSLQRLMASKHLARIANNSTLRL